jgi:hypothetical protein
MSYWETQEKGHLMKHHLIPLAASVVLFAGAAQACPHQTADSSDASGKIILAQATGSGGSTSGGGSAEPGKMDPRKAPPNAPEGPKGAGGTAADPMTTGTIPTTPPGVGSNNRGTGGSNTDSGPLDPRKTPPNAPQ